MDKDLYRIMKELKDTKSTENTKDIRYLKTICMIEKGPNGNTDITKDIFAMLDISTDGKVIVKYYDENQELIAGRGNDGELIPSSKYMYDDLDFLSELDELDLDSGISLDELDNELDQVSKTLGVSKSDILSMSKLELDAIVNEENTDDLILDNSIEKDSPDEHNSDSLDGISAKQTINLNTKVTDKLTMAEVLGVQAGSELIIVNSSTIRDNDVSTRFSCLIKSPNGELKQADMLKQVGGKDSDKNIYATNRDGSKVEQKVAHSSFAIDSPVVKNCIISIKQGDMNHTEVFYGQMDKTSHNDVFVQPLETREMYPVTSRVRDEFSQSKGEYNVSSKMDEIQSHKEKGCEHLSLDEADGNPVTGHSHSEDAVEVILSDNDVGSLIDDIYTHDEIKERFNSIKEEHPDSSFDELVEYTKSELATEAEHMHGNERGF